MRQAARMAWKCSSPRRERVQLTHAAGKKRFGSFENLFAYRHPRMSANPVAGLGSRLDSKVNAYRRGAAVVGEKTKQRERADIAGVARTEQRRRQPRLSETRDPSYIRV